MKQKTEDGGHDCKDDGHEVQVSRLHCVVFPLRRWEKVYSLYSQSVKLPAWGLKVAFAYYAIPYQWAAVARAGETLEQASPAVTGKQITQQTLLQPQTITQVNRYLTLINYHLHQSVIQAIFNNQRLFKHNKTDLQGQQPTPVRQDHHLSKTLGDQLYRKTQATRHIGQQQNRYRMNGMAGIVPVTPLRFHHLISKAGENAKDWLEQSLPWRSGTGGTILSHIFYPPPLTADADLLAVTERTPCRRPTVVSTTLCRTPSLVFDRVSFTRSVLFLAKRLFSSPCAPSQRRDGAFATNGEGKYGPGKGDDCRDNVHGNVHGCTHTVGAGSAGTVSPSVALTWSQGAAGKRLVESMVGRHYYAGINQIRGTIPWALGTPLPGVGSAWPGLDDHGDVSVSVKSASAKPARRRTETEQRLGKSLENLKPATGNIVYTSGSTKFRQPVQQLITALAQQTATQQQDQQQQQKQTQTLQQIQQQLIQTGQHNNRELQRLQQGLQALKKMLGRKQSVPIPRIKPPSFYGKL